MSWSEIIATFLSCLIGIVTYHAYKIKQEPKVPVVVLVGNFPPLSAPPQAPPPPEMPEYLKRVIQEKEKRDRAVEVEYDFSEPVRTFGE